MKTNRIRRYLSILLVVAMTISQFVIAGAEPEVGSETGAGVLAYILDGRLYAKLPEGTNVNDLTVARTKDADGKSVSVNTPVVETLGEVNASTPEYQYCPTGRITEFGYREIGLYRKGTAQSITGTTIGIDQILMDDGQYDIVLGTATYPVTSVACLRKDSGQRVSPDYKDKNANELSSEGLQPETTNIFEEGLTSFELLSVLDAESLTAESAADGSGRIKFCDYVYPVAYNNTSDTIRFTVNGTGASLDPARWPKILRDGVDETFNSKTDVSVKATYPKPANTNEPALYTDPSAVPNGGKGERSLDHMDKLCLYIGGQLAAVRYWDQISKTWYHENTAEDHISMVYVSGNHTYKRGDWRQAIECPSVSTSYVNMSQLWRSVLDPGSMYQPGDAEYEDLSDHMKAYATLSGNGIAALINPSAPDTNPDDAISNIVPGVKDTVSGNTYYSRQLDIADAFLDFMGGNYRGPLPSLEGSMWTTNDATKDRYNVRVSDFWLGRYEVTMQQYYDFVDACTVESDPLPKQFTPKQTVIPDQEAPVVSYNIGGTRYQLNEVAAHAVADKKVTMRDNGWGDGSRPSIDMNWYEAVEFCNYLSRKEGLEPCYSFKNVYNGNYGDGKTLVGFMANVRGSCTQKTQQLTKMIQLVEVSCDFTRNGYRLPTESEFEYAARGGAKVFTDDASADGEDKVSLYAGMDSFDNTNLQSYAWWRATTDNPMYNGSDSANMTKDNMGANGYSSPVGSRLPNQLGLHDMTGNVWENTWDYYNRAYYADQQAKGETIQDDRGPQYSVDQISDMSPDVVVDRTMQGVWAYSYGPSTASMNQLTPDNIWYDRYVKSAVDESGAGKLSHTLRGGCFTNPNLLTATTYRYAPAQTYVQNCINFTDARVGFRLARTVRTADTASQLTDEKLITSAQNAIRTRLHEANVQKESGDLSYEDIADIELRRSKDSENGIEATVTCSYYTSLAQAASEAAAHVYEIKLSVENGQATVSNVTLVKDGGVPLIKPDPKPEPKPEPQPQPQPQPQPDNKDDGTVVTVKKSGSDVITTTSEFDKNGKLESITEVTKDKKNKTVTEVKYNLASGKKIKLKKVKTSKKSVTIPASFKVKGTTYKVDTIAKNAFKGNKKLRTITLKGEPKTIQKGAFKGLSTKAVIKVKNISKKKFKNLEKKLRKAGLSKKIKVKRVK